MITQRFYSKSVFGHNFGGPYGHECLSRVEPARDLLSDLRAL
jgi:hypothetical protein